MTGSKRKARPSAEPLSHRERQVLAVIYKRGEATAADIQAEVPDFPTYNAVRSTLRVLETKGHLRHEPRSRQYVYIPTVPRDQARGSWLAHLVRTLFGGSSTDLVSTLIDERIVSDAELERLERLIRNARQESGGERRR